MRRDLVLVLVSTFATSGTLRVNVSVLGVSVIATLRVLVLFTRLVVADFAGVDLIAVVRVRLAFEVDFATGIELNSFGLPYYKVKRVDKCPICNISYPKRTLILLSQYSDTYLTVTLFVYAKLYKLARELNIIPQINTLVSIIFPSGLHPLIINLILYYLCNNQQKKDVLLNKEYPPLRVVLRRMNLLRIRKSRDALVENRGNRLCSESGA